MKWKDVVAKIPPPANHVRGLNPGYGYLVLPTVEAAQTAMQGADLTQRMPHSTKRFHLRWLSDLPSPTANAGSRVNADNADGANGADYSIYVGDLAPNVLGSDLVAVFRNPLLGLRDDREPRFVAPFTSCKSANIMMDPVTKLCRGHGFVKFGKEADRQRALVEMNGLYCLTRPSE